MKLVQFTLHQVLSDNNLKEKPTKLLLVASKILTCCTLLFSFFHVQADDISEPLILLQEPLSEQSNESSDLLQLLRRQNKSQTKKIELLEQELAAIKEKLKQIKSDLMVKGYSTEKVLKERISKLEQLLTDSQHSLSSVKLQLQEKSQQLALKKQELEHTISSFSDSSKQLSERLQQIEQDLEKENKLVIKQQMQEQSDKNTISSLQKTSKSLEERLQKAFSLIQTLSSQVSIFQLSLEKSESEKTNWKELATKNEEKAASIESYATSLEKILEDKEREADSLKSSLEAALFKTQKKANFFGGALVDSLTRLKHIELKTFDLRKTLSSALQEKQRQSNEAKELSSLLDEERISYQNLLKQYTQGYEEHIAKLEANIAHAEHKALEASNLILDLQQMLSIKTNLSYKQKELISSLNQKAQENSFLALQNKTYTIENQFLKNQIWKAKEAQSFFGTYIKTKQDIRNQMDKALEKHYEVISLEKDSLEESIQQLERALTFEKMEKEQIALLAKELVEEVQGLQRQISSQEEQKASLETILEEMEAHQKQNAIELNILQKMLEEASNKQEISSKEREDLEKELQKLRQEGEEIEGENTSLKQKIDALSPEISQKEQTIKTIQEELEKLQERVELQQEKSDEVLRKLEDSASQRDDLDDENRKLKELLSIIEREKQWLQVQIADYFSEIEAYKATVDLQEKTIEQLEHSLEKERKNKES